MKTKPSRKNKNINYKYRRFSSIFLIQKEIQIALKHLKSCSISLTIREMQIQITWRNINTYLSY